MRLSVKIDAEACIQYLSIASQDPDTTLPHFKSQDAVSIVDIELS